MNFFPHAHWIWPPGDDKPANGHVQFRKHFSLETPPARATVHVSADCKYLLFINGSVVGRGPVPGIPKFKQVDEYDVAPLLRKGRNVVTALVHHAQERNLRYDPVRGGFVLRLDAGNMKLGTDATWKARWAAEFKNDTPVLTFQMGRQEWVDGRQSPTGWETTEFDDSAWDNATVIEKPENVWPRELELRTVPHTRREIVHPIKLVSFFGLSSWGQKDCEPAREIMTAYPMSNVEMRGADGLFDPTKGPCTLIEKQGDGVALVIDLGEEMIGSPFLEIECRAGVTVDIGHGEILSRNRLQTVMMMDRPNEQRFADRYVTREGRQRFELFNVRGCRYLEIHFNKLADFYKGAKVVIHEIGFVRSTPQFDRVSEFTCSDERLTRIWNICLHTAKTLRQDYFLASAMREQCQFPEVIQTMLNLTCFGPDPVTRQMIHTFCRGQWKSGFIPSMIPEMRDLDKFDENETYLYATFAVPMNVWLYWLFAGEDEREPAWLDACERVVNGLAKYVGPHGTLTNLPGIQWVEWSGIDVREKAHGHKESEVTFWNAWFAFMLERIAEMAAAFHMAARAQHWSDLSTSVRRAANGRFWSKQRQAYIDGVYDGAASNTVSQTTNALAVLARLGDESRLRAALTTTEDPKRCDVPSAIYLMSLYHEALQSLGMDGAVLDRIRRKWGVMLDHGATTTWEAEEALERNMELCIPSAAHPLNYLARTALGITPLAPGYREFSVQLVPHDLSHAHGKIPTPHGPIEVAWERKGSRLQLQLTVPTRCNAFVAPPSGGILAKPTEVGTTNSTIATCTFLRTTAPAVRLDAGKHSITWEVSS